MYRMRTYGFEIMDLNSSLHKSSCSRENVIEKIIWNIQNLKTAYLELLFYKCYMRKHTNMDHKK